MPDYLRPETLDDALAALASRPLQPVAGATDVYPAQATKRAWGEPTRADILDITALPGLRGVADAGDHWRIGCLTTWTDIIRASLPPAFDALKAAAREVGGVQIQNRGTLVGNLCNASPAADGAPCLLALDAEIELTSTAGVRHLALDAFVLGNRRTARRGDELATAILIPKSEGHSGFVKLGARKYLVISIVMAAAVIETNPDGRITRARIAIGACSETARRLPLLEAALAGRAPGEWADAVAPEHLAALAPIDDIRATAAWRREAAAVALRDLLGGFGAATGREAA